MRVSIVTVSFNQGRYLEECIESITSQRGAQLEYIVVDPGSTDDSRAIIQRHKHQIDKIILEPDDGPASGLNKGFALATGDIFGFVNADDVLFPNALAEVTEFFSTHPEVDVVSGHCRIIDAEGKILRASYSDRFSLRGYAYGSVVLMQPSTFVRATRFKEVGGFNEANKSNWDGELFVDLKRAGSSFRIRNAFWSGYRLHPSSITGGKTADSRIREYHRVMFRKLMGREWTPRERAIGFALRAWKYFLTPQSLWERIAHGRVYGRAMRS